MKKIKNGLLLVLVLMAGLFITACQKDDQKSVTFDANGGTLTGSEVVKVAKGSLVDEPTAPTRNGYIFKGWFVSDDEGVSFVLEWDFSSRKVETNITLYAKWEEDIDPNVPVSIADVFAASNKDVLTTIGVVFYLDANGVYISDGSNNLFVKTEADYAIGNELRVKGSVSVLGNKLVLDATTVTVEKTDATAITPTALAIKDVVELSADKAAGKWYGYYLVSGILTFNPSLGEYILMSGDGNSQLMLGNTEAEIDDYLGERVELNVVLKEYDEFGQTWKVLFAEDSIKENKYSEAELKDMLNVLFKSAVLDEVLGGGLTLPATLEGVIGIDITWTTDLTDYIEVLPLEDGSNFYRTAITIPEENVEGKLTATITYKDLTPFTMELDILVKTLVKTTLKEAVQNADARSLFDAVVIGFAEGQTLSFKSYIIQDLVDSSVIATVDYNQGVGGVFGSYIEDAKIGDILTFTAQYRTIGRPAFYEIDTVATGLTQDPVYDLDNATVLNTENWAFAGYNKFVKLENPYMQFSTSSAPAITNWVRLSPFIERMTGDYNGRTLAFLIRPLDDLMGKEWRDSLNIPFTGGTPIQYDGSIYGFIIYESASYYQFIAVNPDHFQASNSLIVEDYLKGLIPNRVNEGNLELPTTHDLVEGNIVWTSSDPSVVSELGVITYPEFDLTVTLTATYTVIGKTEETNTVISLVVAGQERVVLEVEEAITQDADALFNVGGYVVQILYTTSTGFPSSSYLNEILIQDRVSGQLLLVLGLADAYSNEQIAIGDEIEFFGKLTIDDVNRKVVEFQEDLRIVNTGVELLDYKSDAITINDHEHANEIFGEAFHFGQVYHISGEVYLTSTTTSGDMTNLNFHLNPLASNNAGKAVGGKRLVFNINNNAPLLGDDFAQVLFDMPADTTVAHPGVAKVIDFYFVVTSHSGSYWYVVALNAGDVKFDVLATLEDDIKASIPTELLTGNIALMTEHELLDGPITWVSSNEAVIAVDGTVNYPSEEVTVTLTYTFEYNGETHSYDIEVLVKAAAAKTVAQVILEANNGDTVFVEGIVVGFHWNGSSTLSNLTNGVILKDATGNDVLYVVGLYGNYGLTRAEYTVGEDTLTQGDKIRFVAKYEVSETEGHTGRKTLVIESAEIANLEILEREVEYSYDLTLAEEITNQEQLQAVAEGLEYGKLYKLSGDFGFRGSASSWGTGVNLQVSYIRTAATDYNMTPSWATGDGTADRGQRFSFKFDGNVPNLGEAWYESLLGITSETYTGTANSGMSFTEGSYIYFYIGHALPRASAANGYLQLVILESEWISATLA